MALLHLLALIVYLWFKGQVYGVCVGFCEKNYNYIIFMILWSPKCSKEVKVTGGKIFKYLQRTCGLGPEKWENTLWFYFSHTAFTESVRLGRHLVPVSQWMAIFMSTLKQFLSVHFSDRERLLIPSWDITFPTEIACHHLPSSRMTNHELESVLTFFTVLTLCAWQCIGYFFISSECLYLSNTV